MELENLIRKDILDIEEYVPGKPIEDVKRELGIDDVIKMASNENPLGPGPKAIKAIAEAAMQAHIYPDGAVYYLKKRLAEKNNVDMSQIIVGNGSDEVLRMLGEVFFKRDDELIVADPTFSEYSFVATLMGAKTIKVPVKKEDLSYDLEGMLAKVNEKTKMVVLCTPNNPVGNIIKEKELADFLERLPKKVIAVIDQAYSEYVTDKDYTDCLAYLKKYPNLIILHTFSKIYALGGMRVGYGLANKEMIDLLNRVKDPFNVNKIGQAAALAALDDDEHYQASLKVNEEGKAYLYKEFAALGLEYIPTETNFIFANLKKDAAPLCNELLKRGVIIRHTKSFGYPEYIRVTIGTKEQNERLIREMRAILQEI